MKERSVPVYLSLPESLYQRIDQLARKMAEVNASTSGRSSGVICDISTGGKIRTRRRYNGRSNRSRCS